MAAAAAGQIAYLLERDARLRAWQAQAAALRDDLGLPEAMLPRIALADPAGLETVRVVPAHREPVPTQPLHAQPALVEPSQREPEAFVRPAQTPLWRRLAVPVGLVSVVLCVGVALVAGPLRGLFSGSPPSTQAVATVTLAAVSVASETAANTEPPATATLSPTNTTAPTAAPTATRTAVPSPTPTEPPTATATEPLPADVLAVGTVTLAEGIVGRLRDAPNGTVVGGVTNGTVVHVISAPQTTDDGITWVRIRLPDTGQTGWVGESLLQYSTPPPS